MPSPAGLTGHLRGWLADLGLALALGATALIEAVIDGCRCGSRPHGIQLAMALGLLTTMPVALRRHRPLLALMLCTAGGVASTLLGVTPAAAGFASILIALYTVSMREVARVSAATAAVVFLVTVWELRGQGPAGMAMDLALVTVAWVIGHDRRTSRALLDAMAARARVEERSRIARELHDLVAHSLSMMVVQAGAGRRVVMEAPEVALETLASIEGSGREAMAEMRRLLGILRLDEAGSRGPQPGLGQMEDLLADFRRSGLEVETCLEGDPRPLPAGVDLSAYRIIQEAMTNCLKHSGGALVRLHLRWTDHDLLIEVVDEGEWTAPTSGGQGLVGMRERVELVGGTLDAGPSPEGGWRVAALLPSRAGG